jgi:chitodextrinase
MGTSVVIGQRRAEATDYDTIWDYVGVTNYGVVPGWDGISPVGDTQPPSVPSNVTATGLTMNSIQVGWTASTDNVGVTGYNIFRNGGLVGTSATTSYTDTGLTPSTTYSYKVSAYDAQGNNSAQSSPPAQGTTLGDTQAPGAPSNAAATVQTPRQVKVTWTASTDNVGVTGYKVYRNGSQVGTSATTSYTDTGLQQNSTYTYTLSAYDAAANNSAPSSPPVMVTTMTAIDIDEAKTLTDTSSVGMVSKIVTAIYSGCFYVEEVDKYSGIKIVPLEMPGELAVGGVVDVGGIAQTANGQRYIANAVVTIR